MPTPAAPDGGRAHPLAAAAALFRQLHDQLRAEVGDVDDDVLNRIPTDGANSMATLVVHLLASEAETLSAIAALPVTRDRDAEFEGATFRAKELLVLLDDADALLRRVTVTAPDLGRSLALPTLPADELRPAMTWLIANYGHAREHFGQFLLTKQLALQS